MNIQHNQLIQMKPKKVQPIQGIQQLIDELTRRWNAHDAAALTELFTTDARFTDDVGQMVVGRTQIEQLFDYPFRKMLRQAVLTVDEFEIQPICDNAVVVHLRWTTTGNLSTSGMPLPPRDGVMQLVFQKQKDGIWQVASGINNNLTTSSNYATSFRYSDALDIW
ncbi:MAG: hypothetical protein RLZZ628_2639 [Bacteroidota bacterium]|jgi:uncharacterized protein (TIGR02246 family)